MGNRKLGALSEGIDLTEASPGGAHVRYRDSELTHVLNALGRGRSVLLLGPPGVGKTSVVHALASSLRSSGRARLFEFAVVQMLSGTKYLGEWQTKVTRVFEAAATHQALLYFADIWNLPSAGKASNRDDTVWDALRPRLERGEFQLVGEVSPEQLLRLQATQGFLSMFEVVSIEPLSDEQVADVVEAATTRLDLHMGASTRRRLLELCRQFLPAQPGPGPALDLLAKVKDYLAEKAGVDEAEELSPEFVEKVFSIYSGLPRFVVSRHETQPADAIREWFRERLIGQDAAIEAVVEMIAVFKAGLHDPERPIGTFLFVGPTGVGKTELARALARYLFGTARRLLRLDMSEFKDYHSFQLLVGDPDHPNRPDRLISPIRAQPFQVMLFDELEKAHSNVWDLMLQLLDEGRLTSAGGDTVSFRNTILIATSNVGATDARRSAIGFSVPDASQGQQETMRQDLENVFRPEFLNRFQHLIQFHPLSREQVLTIARREISHVLNREGITARNLTVDISDEVLDLIVSSGHDQLYGARSLKREVQRIAVMPIATHLLERRVEPDSILTVGLRKEKVHVATVDTEGSRASRSERAPVHTQQGARMSRKDLAGMLHQAREEGEAIANDVDESGLREEQRRVDGERAAADFWQDKDRALDTMVRYERIHRVLGRLGRLQEAQSRLEALLDGAEFRTTVERLADQVVEHRRGVDSARRELVILGSAGFSDALIDIRPVANAAGARGFIFDIYREWAASRGYAVDVLYEPLSDDDRVFAAIRGPYAVGYLHLEAGLHRRRIGQHSDVVRVRVAPWSTGSDAEVSFATQRALKKTGQLGGRIRSRVEVHGTDVVLQNSKTVAENRELAEDIARAWLEHSVEKQDMIRRYDLSPLLVSDYLTSQRSGRADALKAERFHDLLCARIDVAAGSPAG